MLICRECVCESECRDEVKYTNTGSCSNFKSKHAYVKVSELNDLLCVVRSNMTSITRYVRHNRDDHPTLTEGQFLDQNLQYKELANTAVGNILDYINGKVDKKGD